MEEKKTVDPNKYYIVKPDKDSPEIVFTLYDTLVYYRDELIKAENELPTLEKNAKNAFLLFKNQYTGMENILLKQIEEAKKAVEDEKEEEDSDDENVESVKSIDEEDIENEEEDLEEDINEEEEEVEESEESEEPEEEREKTEKEKTLDKLVQKLKDEQRYISDLYKERDMCKKKIEGYVDLFDTTNKIYKDARLKNNIKGQYTKKDNIEDKINDVIDVYESKNKNIRDISIDGVNQRITYQRFVVSKDSPKKLSETDVIKNEDGYRNEYLFKKLYIPSIHRPEIDITKKKFYAPYDFENKKDIFEMKTVIQHENQKEIRFFVSIKKVKELIEAGKKLNKEPNLYWYVEEEKGYLSKMSLSSLNGITKEQYEKNLYTLVDPLTEKTFTKKDIYTEGGNLNQDTYMLRGTDKRISSVR